MKTDLQIQQDVMDEITWLPFLHAAEIGVAVKNGVVTLSGQVDTYSKKIAAENAAKKISGVKAVAEDIQVGVSPVYRKTDAEIAEAVLNALKWNTAVQEEKVKIKVENGIVTLQGEVEWAFQRNNAKTAIQNLTGVRSIVNLIEIKPKVSAFELEQKIGAAFRRNANIDAGRINVTVNGSKVILTGRVSKLTEKDEAENAVWAAPGVYSVESKLTVEEPEGILM
jgi:osmotically-inducible protein OsmY